MGLRVFIWLSISFIFLFANSLKETNYPYSSHSYAHQTPPDEIQGNFKITRVIIKNQDLKLNSGKLVFNAGRYNGTIGCNYFFGDYKINSKSQPTLLFLHAGASTRKFCGSFDQAERVFLGYLAGKFYIFPKGRGVYLIQNQYLKIWLTRELKY